MVKTIRTSSATRARANNGSVAAFAVLVGAAFFAVPFMAHFSKTENLNSKEKALNASQIRRGVYMNSGSKDVGVDPDWDFRTNTWQGRRAGDPPRPKGQPKQETHD